MLLKELKDKDILILGFGREGKDNLLALRKLFPNKVLAIADQQPIKKKIVKVKIFSNQNYLSKIGDYDLILKTPGIPLAKIKPLLKKGAKIISQTNLFFDNFPGLIIGVTGTKGKGTTASIIYSILKKAKKKVHLVGNIGQPVLQKLLKAKLDEIFVYELSSHQLQGLKKSPQIAVFLNLFSDHLDYYKSFKEYQKAKESITIYQTKKDYFIYNQQDKTGQALAKKTKAQKMVFSAKDKNDLFKIIKEKDIPLKGQFNLLNVMAAVKVAQVLKINQEAIKEGIMSFHGLPHRLEFIGQYQGIEFYNDSMATLPESAVVAIEALSPKVVTLIAGGSDKGSNYQKMAKAITQNKIKNLIILGQGTGQKIVQDLQRADLCKVYRGLPSVFIAGSMKEAVEIAFQETEKGQICLLSPGAASFNLFKSYVDRGEQFVKWLKFYGKDNSKNKK